AGLVQQLVPPVPEDLLGLRVDEHDAPLVVDPDDGVGSGLEQVAEPAVGGRAAQRGRGGPRLPLRSTGASGGGRIGSPARARLRGPRAAPPAATRPPPRATSIAYLSASMSAVEA